jgi:hypothetical protein
MPPIEEVPWSGSQKIKRKWEGDHSPPLIAELKNEWRYTSTCYMPSCLGQGNGYVFSCVKRAMKPVRNFYLDFGLMKILLQSWVWQCAGAHTRGPQTHKKPKFKKNICVVIIMISKVLCD